MDIRGGGEQNPRDKSADDVVSTLEAIFEPDIKLLEGPDDSAYTDAEGNRVTVRKRGVRRPGVRRQGVVRR